MSPEKEKLVNENIRLVWHVWHKNKQYFAGFLQYEDDFISAGNLGLVKAANTFDPDKGFKFATYAVMCIRNQMLMQRRELNKFVQHEVSESDTLTTDDEGHTRSYLETVPSDDEFADVDRLLLLDSYYPYVQYAYENSFSDTQRRVFDEWITGAKQREIAERVGFTQSYVCRVKEIIINKIKGVRYMKMPSSPYCPRRGDYDDVSEYSKDYQRYHYLKTRGREKEFIPYYGRHKGVSYGPVEEVEIKQEIQSVTVRVDDKAPTIKSEHSVPLDKSCFSESIKALTLLEEDYISRVKKIRAAKQTLLALSELK